MQVKNLTSAVVVISTILAGCGGGGGGDSLAPTPVAVPAPTTPIAATPIPTTEAVATPVVVATPSNTVSIQTQAQTSNYPVGSAEKAAFDYLNQERLKCGFGSVSQNTLLDKASAAHANYLVQNNLSGHYEDSQRFPLGFTGVYPVDRAVAAGYLSDVQEELTGDLNATPEQSKGDFGTRTIRKLITAPFHQLGVLSPATEFGVGSGFSSSLSMQVALMGYSKLQQSTEVLSYPCEGMTLALNGTVADERPAPIPGRNLGTNPIGQPILFRSPAGTQLQITSYKVIEVGVGEVAVLILNQATDPTKVLVGATEVLLMPDKPFKANANYQVQVIGTVSGAPFAKTINFKSAP
jgi:uncharacterized protein YkwD